MKKAIAAVGLALFLLFTIFIYQYFSFNDGRLHVIVCDVGQGDAVFIRTPKGSDILIDGGPNDRVLDCLASNMPFWDRDIEAIILTHPHADHLTGLISVLERYQVKSFNTEKVPSSSDISKLLTAKLAEENLNANYLYVGDRFWEGDELELVTKWPSLEAISRVDQSNSNLNFDLNGFSVVNLLRYKKFKMLFTGDAGQAVGDAIDEGVGEVDVLKVPHHGSKTGMTSEFLVLIDPSLAVISVGEKNRYGHPAQFSLDLLNKIGAKTLRTDQDGEIHIVTDGEMFTYSLRR